MPKTLGNEQHLEAYRGLRKPAWRLELAGRLPPHRKHRLVREADADVRAVHHFQLLRARGKSGKTRAEALYPAIAAAFALNQDEARCTAAKILTLGGCERSEIAARLGVEEQILEKWESLFFDVREWRDAVGWIHHHVIQPEYDRENGQLASKMKAATAGGPIVARAILDLESRVPVTAAEKLFDRQLALHLKLDAALELPLSTNREKMFFIKLYAQLQWQEKRLKLTERKLEKQCAEAHARQERTRIRLEMTEQRATARAAERARRQHERELVKAVVQQQCEHLAARRQDQLRAEQEAAAARAAASPLSALAWGSTGGSTALPSRDGGSGTQAENQPVDRGDSSWIVVSGSRVGCYTV